MILSDGDRKNMIWATKFNVLFFSCSNGIFTWIICLITIKTLASTEKAFNVIIWVLICSEGVCNMHVCAMCD